MSRVQGYKKLLLAITFEVFGTTMLVLSNGFSKVIPTVLAIISYTICFYIMTYVIRTIKIGVAYALWAGIGIIAINTVGFIIFQDPFQEHRIVGMLLIISGVVVTYLTKDNEKDEFYD